MGAAAARGRDALADDAVIQGTACANSHSDGGNQALQHPGPADAGEGITSIDFLLPGSLFFGENLNRCSRISHLHHLIILMLFFIDSLLTLLY